MGKDSKPDDTSSLKLYIRLLKYLKGKTGHLTLSILGFLVFGLSQPMLAKLMEVVIESIEKQDTDARWLLPAMALGVYTFRGIGSFIGNYFNALVGTGVIRDLKLETFKHLTHLPAAFYDSSTQGKLIHNLNASVKLVQNTITNALKTLIREGITIIALVGYVFYLNWQLSMVFLVVAPILLGLVSLAAKRLRKFARRSEKALGNAMQISKEMISNYGLVRSFGSQDYEKARYERAVNKSFEAQLKSRKVGALFTPIAQVIVSCAVASIVFLLLSPSILDQYSAGELIGYLTAIALLPKSIKQLGGIGVTIQQGLVGAEMVFNLLDASPEPDLGTHTTNSVQGKIEFRNLDFKYPKGKQPALENISTIIAPGELIALVGPSGSGKSTLSSLIYRLYEVDSGKIFLDDIDINDYKLDNLRSHIAIVGQNVRLFDDTLRNNIAYGDVAYSDEQIADALRHANAWEFVEKLPLGLDTPVGENGLKFSGGQRQRISLARAFLKDARILILDEATSALDNESETAVAKAIDEITADKTTIVIAHRLKTIQKADRVIVIERGRIVKEASPDQILANSQELSRLEAMLTPTPDQPG
ncbi:MAG: lipid A export permease/ATP-binding protein MsbA [Pseudomonadota bacterium]|nr:lipid A export permease/ATP-binding protein MsbA [Pseudomonadota bacterium]